MIEHVSITEDRLKILKKTNVWKEKLKEFLDITVDVGEDVTLDGDPLQVIRAKEIIKAFGRGFDFESSLDLLDEEYFLEVINLGEFTGKSKNRGMVLRGRVIGKEGKTKKMIERYADTKIAIYGKTVSMIGKPQSIRVARDAIEMILSGSKHNTVYRFLQENNVV